MPNSVTPFLWYQCDLREVIDYYRGIFPSIEVFDTVPGPDGGIFTARFRLFGQELFVLNGGPEFTFNEAFSLFVSCNGQDEVDDLWAKLTANGGEESQCGWLKDRYGLSWQIIPTRLMELLGDPNPERASRAQQAMLQMQKIDIAALEAAANG